MAFRKSEIAYARPPGHDDLKGPGADSADTNEWIRRTYKKIHRIAVTQMNRERCGHTLSATSLIHEAFLRLRSGENSTWMSERQFLFVVASEMRRVLVDAARRKRSLKRGGLQARSDIPDSEIPQSRADSAVLAESVVELYEALETFEKIEPEKAELVRLRYVLGLTEAEAAQTLGISRATASRQWTFARAWLLDFLTANQE